MNNHRLLTGLLAAALLSGGMRALGQTRQILTIEELFEIAETNSAQLRPSFAAEEEARREISVARSGWLPDINANLALSFIGDGFTTKRDFSDYQKAPIPHFGSTFGLNISQPVYSGGAISAGIELAKALLETAELNLSYCVIAAPCDGYASRKEIKEGQLVQPGQTLLDVVDTSDVWVAANYKETQLKHIAPGSDVTIRVDAVPDVVFDGKVKSISKATGASLSILPQDNSAGNFVKVRQRVPVRIIFTDSNSEADMQKLRAGMNVECEVRY